MEAVALIRRMFLRLVTKITDRFLEQRINIKFCVKLGENVSGTCAVLSEAYGGEAMKNSSASEWHKQFKQSSHVEITNNKEKAITFFDIKGTVHFQFFAQGR
jgi:hypothetical protein